MHDINGHASASGKWIQYLDVFRTALIRVGVVVLLFSIGGYFAAGTSIRFLQRLTGVTLVAFGIPETFFTFLKLSLGIGLLASVPCLLYGLLAPLPAVFPGFRRRTLFFFWGVSILLFYSGALFSLLVSLPYGIQYLMGFETPHIAALISVKKFVSFCLMVVFGFGIIFELPLAMVLVGRIGLVNAAMLSRYRRYAILAVSVISAVLTPTPDVLNMALMGIPLYLLFELGLLGMRVLRKTDGSAP